MPRIPAFLKNTPYAIAGVCGLLLVAVVSSAPTEARVLDFDEVTAGTVLNEHYAFMGVHISATGTDLDEVIAAVPCGTAVSAPNVLSYQALGECPATRDESGWFVVDFDQPQNLVAITAVHEASNTVAYLEAYGVDGFIDNVFTSNGASEVGVPQRMQIAPLRTVPASRRFASG